MDQEFFVQGNDGEEGLVGEEKDAETLEVTLDGLRE